jgi:hypothetical protein
LITGVSSVAVLVNDAMKSAERSGVEFAKELTVTSWGATAIQNDPDGNEFEIP